MQRYDQTFFRDGRLYVAIQDAPLACGSFLPSGSSAVEEHLVLPPSDELRTNYHSMAYSLFAAKVRGDSMKYRGILDGDYVLIRRCDSLQNGQLMVIERLDEEGYGAWTLKRVLIRKPRAYHRNTFGDDIDSDNPELVLYSYNGNFAPWALDPTGNYRVRGVLLRALPPDLVTIVSL